MSFEHSHLFNHKEDMQAIGDVSLEAMQKMMAYLALKEIEL